jgi:phosphatidate cytidylyltransferase
MFIARLATAVVLLAACISALLYLPNAWWAALLIPVLLIASREWAALAGIQGGARWIFSGIVLAAAAASWLLVASHPAEAGGLSPAETAIYGAACVFWLLMVVPWLARFSHVKSVFVLGCAGLIVLVPAWLALARLQASPGRLLAVLMIIWLADTAAYLSGRAWGRHRLAPAISPGKTWEGVAGAAVAVAVYYFILSRVAPEWGWWSGYGGAILFAGVAVMSVVGDLFESAIKRQAGVKDSGTLLPGHGGVLDRIDSLTAALPMAAVLMPYAG